MPQTDPKQRLLRRLRERVNRFATRQALWPSDGLLVAVSGGPDSSALLHIMATLASKRRLPLVAAYFDHGLRSEASCKAEAEAVSRLCMDLGVELVRGEGEVRELARRQKRGIEAAARSLRYRFLATVAREKGCSYVATGHTASDQAETVLLHLIRGSGLRGLAAMAPRSSWPSREAPDLKLVRPLLELQHSDTLDYCQAVGLSPVHDESNDSADFARNRVRHEVLPLLRQLNPGVDSALTRLAEVAREESALLEGLLPALADGAESELKRESLVQLPDVLRLRLISRAVEVQLGDLDGISRRHLVALDEMAVAGSTGDRLELPRGLSAVLTRQEMILRIGSQAMSLPQEGVCLSIPEETGFGPLTVAAAAEPIRDAVASVTVDAAAVTGPLTVRSRRTGDRFQPLGMQQSKKLQDFLVDAHVPRELRDSIPIFVTGRGIAWVGGMRIAEWARPRQGAPVLTLSYRLGDSVSTDPTPSA